MEENVGGMTNSSIFLTTCICVFHELHWLYFVSEEMSLRLPGNETSKKVLHSTQWDWTSKQPASLTVSYWPWEMIPLSLFQG